MKKLSLGTAFVAATALAATLAVSGPAQATTPPTPTPQSQSTTALTPQQQATLAELTSKLPKDWKQRKSAAEARLGIEKSPAQEVLEAKLDALARGINPADYQCGPTKLDAYINSILADLDQFTLLILQLTGALGLPTYDALLNGTSSDPVNALLPEYAASLTSTFATSKKFWDVNLRDVQLMAMHGSVILNEDRMTQTVMKLYGMTEAEAREYAAAIAEFVQGDPVLQGGDHPIFTLNAFAFTAEGDPDPLVRGLPDKIVMGDGILAAMKGIGLDAVGPRSILSHEIAHQVQYEANLFATPITDEAEQTRRTEMMADSFTGYFATHKHGLKLPANQLLQVQDSFYAVGDCSFTSPGHHGTPNQRRAATAWGITVSATSSARGVVYKARVLGAMFDAVLPQLVAPDAAALEPAA